MHGLKKRLISEMMHLKECIEEGVTCEYLEELDVDDLYRLLEESLNYIDRMEKGVKGNVGDFKPAA